MPQADQLLRDQGRGILGALLLGTPVLFTMETWWLGWRLPLWSLLLFAALGLAGVTLVLRHGGFRKDEERPHGLRDWGGQFAALVLQSLAAAYAVLFLYGVLEPGDPLAVIARSGAIELVPLGLGAAAANSILKGSEAEDVQRRPLPQKVAIVALGAVFFTLQLASTEEMPLMAAHAGWWRLLAIAAVSVSATYLALYELGFRGQSGRASLRVRHRIGEAFLVYVLCLAVAAVLLAGYGQFQGQPPELWVQEIVVLGFPAAMGGAAAQVVF